MANPKGTAINRCDPRKKSQKLTFDTFPENHYKLVVEPTFLKNITVVKLGHETKNRGENSKNI